MENLERYLDQVCRGIAGPRSMRQHIRQELREHLLDAASGHRAAGMSEQDALTRAIEDFGGPEQVRSELEATHGHRFISVVIDKAMQWKERTMKAKWIISTWAHLALACVIAAEVVFICLASFMVLPKFISFVQCGWLDSTSSGGSGIVTWAVAYMRAISAILDGWLFWVVPLVMLWIAFEWRFRSENKTLIRLSVMGTIALKLMFVTVFTAAALSLPFFVELPLLIRRPPEPVVRDTLGIIETSANAMERAFAKNDWDAMQREAATAQDAFATLDNMGSAIPVMLTMREQAKVDELRGRLTAARRAIWEIRRTVGGQDEVQIQRSVRDFHAAYEGLRSATSQPANAQ